MLPGYSTNKQTNKLINTCFYFNLCSFFVSFLLCPGSMQFPYNPLTMRILNNTPPTSIASPAIQSQQQQQPPQPPAAAAPVGQQRVWQSLLSEKYETLSDSDDWAPHIQSSVTRRGLRLFSVGALTLLTNKRGKLRGRFVVFVFVFVFFGAIGPSDSYPREQAEAQKAGLSRTGPVLV